MTFALCIAVLILAWFGAAESRRHSTGTAVAWALAIVGLAFLAVVTRQGWP